MKLGLCVCCRFCLFGWLCCLMINHGHCLCFFVLYCWLLFLKLMLLPLCLLERGHGADGLAWRTLTAWGLTVDTCWIILLTTFGFGFCGVCVSMFLFFPEFVASPQLWRLGMGLEQAQEKVRWHIMEIWWKLCFHIRPAYMLRLRRLKYHVAESVGSSNGDTGVFWEETSGKTKSVLKFTPCTWNTSIHVQTGSLKTVGQNDIPSRNPVFCVLSGHVFFENLREPDASGS